MLWVQCWPPRNRPLKKVDMSPQVSVSGVCPICQRAAQNTLQLQCAHEFCSECIVEHLRRGATRCPTCRDDPYAQAIADDGTTEDDTDIQGLVESLSQELEERQTTRRTRVLSRARAISRKSTRHTHAREVWLQGKRRVKARCEEVLSMQLRLLQDVQYKKAVRMYHGAVRSAVCAAQHYIMPALGELPVAQQLDFADDNDDLVSRRVLERRMQMVHAEEDVSSSGFSSS